MFTGIIRYLRDKVGSFMLYGGGAFTLFFAFILYGEVQFHSQALEVQATVVEVKTKCVLEWKAWTLKGKRTKTSEKMDCMEARAIKQSDPAKKYTLKKRKQFKLAYSAPDGRTYREWSKIRRHQGQELFVGRIITAAIDPEDPSDVRAVKDIVDFFDGMIALFCGILVAFFGAVLIYFKPKPKYHSYLEQLDAYDQPGRGRA